MSELDELVRPPHRRELTLLVPVRSRHRIASLTALGLPPVGKKETLLK